MEPVSDPTRSRPRALTVEGTVEVEVRDAESGALLRRSRHRNLVTTEGLRLLTELWLGSARRPSAIAVGTATSPPAITDLALGVEVHRANLTRREGIDATATFQLLVADTEANGYTLAEEGLFADGVLLARALISPPIVKTSGISVTVSHQLELS